MNPLNKNFIFLLIVSTIFINSYSSTPLYFCTASDEKYFDRLLNLIGSIHKTNFNNLQEIAVFNLGLNQEQINCLDKIQKIKVYEVERVHPDVIKQFKTHNSGKTVPGWYAFKPVVIKQCLDMFPYILWIDAGTTVLKPLDNLFKFIKQNGYFLTTVGDDQKNGKFIHGIEWQSTKYILEKFNILNNSSKKWILFQEAINASIIGISKKSEKELALPFYECLKDFRSFEDDGTTPEGFGTSRHDQSILGLIAYSSGLKVLHLDYTQQSPIYLDIEKQQIPLRMTWNHKYVSENTDIYCSRNDLTNFNHLISFIKYKQL